MNGKVEGHTFKGWYLLDRLLSKALHYDFNVDILRASLPAIRAVYVKSAVANEEITSSSPIKVSFVSGQLKVTTLSPLRLLQVFSFTGQKIGAVGVMNVADQYRLSLPNIPVIIQVETTEDKKSTHKISPTR